MSWNMTAKGTPNAVKAVVEKEKAYGDTSQLETAKALILAELAAWPTPGVSLASWGHHDSTNRSIRIEMTIADVPAAPTEEG